MKPACILIILTSRERKLGSKYHTWRIGELALFSKLCCRKEEEVAILSADTEAAMSLHAHALRFLIQAVGAQRPWWAGGE